MRQLSSILKGCVLHMPLDEATYNPATRRFTDKSAGGHHGTSGNVAGFTVDRMGQITRAMSFNGTTDHIPCGDLGFTADPFTLCAWWCQTSAGAHPLQSFVASLLKCDHPSAGAGFAPVGGININVSYGRRGDHYSSFTVPHAYNYNIWHHTMLTYDGTTIKTYFDNQEIDSRALDIPLSPMAYIGRYSFRDNYYFEGNIADVWIHNRALSESERTYLYESYNPSVII